MEKLEITKSVAMKVNIGDYQTLDFFVSVKAEANGDAEKVAKELHDFCVKQVAKDYNGSVKKMAELVSKEARKKLLDSEV